MQYQEFDKFPFEARKRQIEACFRQGVMLEPMSKAMLENAESHKKNAEALERVLDIFSDAPPRRRSILRMKERLENEKRWVKHYEECEAQHKNGRSKLNALVKNVDFKIVVETVVKKEYEAKAKKPKDEPPPIKKDNPAQMVTKLLVPDDNPAQRLRGAARRRFFMSGQRPN